MKAALIAFLVLIGTRAYTSPQTRALEQRAGIDLLAADYVHLGRGNYGVIIPDKTPFDSDAEARRRYQHAFVAGFESGFSGILHPYVPETRPVLTGELEGWSAGQWSGYRAHQKEVLSSHKRG